MYYMFPTALFSSRKDKGFTLIELLVVIAIIGLLASIILASLNSARVKGRDARRVADMKDIQTALELYYSNHNAYPIQTAAHTTNAQFTTDLNGLVTDGDMSSIPIDPGSNAYKYLSTANGSFYCLGTNVEGTAPSSTCNATALGTAAPATGTGAYNVGP